MKNTGKHSIRYRLTIVLIMLTSSVFSLTGCHGSKGLPEFSVPESFDTSKDYNITFWSKNESNKSQVQVYQKAISDFQAMYPNIHVTMKQYTDYNRIYNDVITNISTNTTPNVCITYPDHVATYRTGINIVVPLDSLIDNPAYGFGGSDLLYDSATKEEVISEFLDEGLQDGNHYVLPFMRSTEACYINKDMLKALGYDVPDVLTWDFIWEVSEKAMEKNPDGTFKINSQNVLIPCIYKSTDNMMITMLKQLNAPYATEDGKVELFNDETTNILKTIAAHAKTGSFSTFKISSYPGNFLNAGQCIFAIDSTAGATWMGSDAPLSDIDPNSKVTFNTVVRPVPQYDTQNIKMISQGPSICIFNKEDSQEVLASWLFAQYLLSNDVQVAYSKTEGYVPVTNKARYSDEYKEYLSLYGTDNNLHYNVKLDATSLLLSNTENTFVTPVFNGTASVRNAAGALVEDVVKSERRGKEVDDAFIDNEYKSLTSLYRLDQISTTSQEKKELGELPSTAVALIISLIITWILIIIYEGIRYRKEIKQFFIDLSIF